jgi:predicted ATPase
MAQLAGIRIQNYRALKDVSFGPTFERRENVELPRLIAMIGPNGCGKSSVMDAFGFIGDCLRSGVEGACDKNNRGGFERLRTQGQEGPLKFDLYYRESPADRPISYSLHINIDSKHRPYVAKERLRQRRPGQTRGWPFSYLDLNDGKGSTWAGAENKKTPVELEDDQHLGITSLGNLKEHPRIVALRKFLEGWYLSYFVPDQARSLPTSGAQKHLNRTGENLANYLQHIERQHKDRFDDVLKKVAKSIPGVRDIKHSVSQDKRLLIQFNDQGYKDPFYQQDMSDGTLKMLAYLLLLEDPEPAPLIGIEEPENGLHHKLLQPLAQAMRKHAQAGGSQIFVTTHSPFFVDALTPEEVWVLQKNDKGFSTSSRAADELVVQSMYSDGIPLGNLWYSDHFGKGNP